MALRQKLLSFTSKLTQTRAIKERTKVALGEQMYSTVIEGLKYAASHEWYVLRALKTDSILDWFCAPLCVCVFGILFFSSMRAHLLLWREREIREISWARARVLCSRRRLFCFFSLFLFPFQLVAIERENECWKIDYEGTNFCKLIMLLNHE